MKKITRSQLEKTISKETNLSKEVIGAVLDSFIDNVTAALQNGDSVTVPRLGRFEVRQRVEKNYTNPKTGERGVLPANTRPAFAFGATVKQKFKE